MHGKHDDGARPLAIMQLNHTGRQSPRFVGGRYLWQKPVAPSSVPLGSNSREGWFARCIYGLLFQRPKPLAEDEIGELIDKFKRAALLACETGFDGVQLHASHGCRPFLPSATAF
jgi:2,4-dienoyl-CoA reductase-like NADH-dependent reductase (Old Yellow Enzyme family)